jgi:2-polyprenyl-3-methyl-5-hydroxy-6-metoxy-1,4-benzoquinol methylase
MLYDAYRKGNARTDTYFYLARENYIAHNWEEFLKFYELFNRQADKDELISGTNVFVSIYEFGINYKLVNREKYTLEEIKSEIDTAIEKYPQLPIHYYYKGMYYAQFDYKKAIQNLEYALDIHKTYEGFYIDTFGSLVVKTYNELATFYKTIHLYDKAFDCLVFVLKKEPLNKEAFREMLQLINNQEDADIILFINQFYDIKNESHVAFLSKQLMNSKCHKTFLYYAMKFNKEFAGQDETTYRAMISSCNEEMAVKTALKAYVNGQSEDDRYFAALSLLKYKNIDFFEEHRSYLHLSYATIINKYLRKEKVENPSPEEIHAFKHLYGHMRYIAAQEDLEEMESMFNLIPMEIVINSVQCELLDKNYYGIIDKVNKYKQMKHLKNIYTQLDKLYAFATYFIEDYGQSLTYFERVLKDRDIDIDKNIILYLKVISTIENNEVISAKAAKLCNQYEPIFREYVIVEEILRTDKIKRMETEYDNIRINEITQQTLEKITKPLQEKLPYVSLKNLFNLMETYVEKEMSEAAHCIILKLLKNEYKKDILYYRLGEIYTEFGNPEVSLYCHKKVFEENAIFAESLIKNTEQSNRGYIYKEVDYTENIYCPLCGGEAEIQSVFNNLPSPDFEEGFPPIKVWRYCPKCHHKFTAQQPKTLSFNITEEKAKMEMKQMPHQVIKYEGSIKNINKYVQSGKLLDIGSGDGAFLAAAMEHGFDAKGIEPIKALSKKISQLLDIVVDNTVFQEYVTEERYEVISLIRTLEGLLEPKKALEKVHQMLNNEGILYIETPNFDSGFARGLKNKCKTLYSAKIIHYFSKKSLQILFENCGFEILDYQMSKRSSGYMEVIARKNIKDLH